jgi:predicted transcriptional regulator
MTKGFVNGGFPMTRTPAPKRPTDSELAILRILWEEGPSTVRQVLAELNLERATGYTTALKMMQIMTEKGLIWRDENARPQVYRTRLSREQTERQLVRDLLDRAFAGSAKRLVLQALAVKKASAEEMAEIEKLLNKLEEEKP